VIRAIADGWNRFWFEPRSTSTLGVIRIAYGIVALGWTISLAPDLNNFFTREGVVPQQPSIRWWFDPLQSYPSHAALYSLYAVLLLGFVCLLIGYHSRIASIVVFLGILTLERRNPYIFNSGDLLVRNLAFYLALAPTGAALSLDRWRKFRDRFWEYPARAPWATRLIQLQLSFTYAATVWAKVRGETWNDGTAVSFALRIGDLERFHAPGFITHNIWASNLMTLGTLALETSLAFLVWNRKARPYVLGLGILMHVLIAVNIMVGFFSMAIITAYIAFIEPDTMERLIDRVRGRGTRRAMKPAQNVDVTPATT
jgi:hypothetical protein